MFDFFRFKKSGLPIFLYNTLSRKKELFEPIKKGEVKMYTCGPTVYNYPHIGNLRTFIFEDVLKRVLEYNGYKVNHVMNITDVGHLTNDRDMGEDKIEQEAKKEGKTAWQIAEFYTEAFKKDLKNLNIEFPATLCKATDNIKEQIAMIETLERKGFAYKTSDGIYFDTAKVSDYAKLSHQNIEELKEGARVEANPEKRNPTDFALWKFSKKNEKRQMEWPSPWGVGFPGWHIECSAMSMKYLGDHFDIHCGGIDAVSVHHTNEIAQSEAATGKSPWVNYWLHGAFLNIANGEKMAKSAGNFLTLENSFVEKGINPLVFRFATFMTHYRKPMEWSYDILAGAKNGFDSLMEKISHLGNKKGQILTSWKDKFLIATNDDLNMPQALAILNELLKSDEKPENKLATILDFDKVLGLKLGDIKNEEIKIPDEVQKLLDERQAARKNKNWKKSDELRDKLKGLGFEVKDTPNGQEVRKI
jgi:cysteinyl-tRNA synthetase